MLPRVLLAIWIAVAASTIAWGFPYYRLPLAERPYSDLHAMFSPAGFVGLIYGMVGTACMLVGVSLYIARKRLPILRTLGPLNSWLQVHIFLCTMGPFFILLHTSFRVNGIVAIAFWSMMAVAGSGAFGRYIYGHLPRTIQGHVKNLESIKTQKNVLIKAMSGDAGIAIKEVRNLLGITHTQEPRGVVHAILMSLRYDFSNRLRRRKIRRFLKAQSISEEVQRWFAKLFQEQLKLEQQILLLKPFKRVFHLWHLVHLPLSILMLAVVVLHIGVAIMMGYAWPT